jgi:2,3-bisphosphoglycerate-dependent phosphoglycerate mutase
MPRIIAALIRHGDYHQLSDTPSAWQPFPLNEQGQEHARAAAIDIDKVIEEKKWSLEPACDASQLLRAWQTADIIGEQLVKINPSHPAINISSFDALAERGVGSVANLSISAIEDIVKNDPRYEDLPENWKSNSRYCLPFQGAESLIDSGERVAMHIKNVMSSLRNTLNKQQKQADTLKLFVGHGAAFRHAAYHLGILEFEQIAKLSMYHGQPVYLELLENNKWKHVLGNWKIRGNMTSYKD